MQSAPWDPVSLNTTLPSWPSCPHFQRSNPHTLPDLACSPLSIPVSQGLLLPTVPRPQVERTRLGSHSGHCWDTAGYVCPTSVHSPVDQHFPKPHSLLGVCTEHPESCRCRRPPGTRGGQSQPIPQRHHLHPLSETPQVPDAGHAARACWETAGVTVFWHFPDLTLVLSPLN